MNVKAKILEILKTDDGRLLAKLQFNEKLPPANSYVDVRWGSKRTLNQNAFLWVYYNWLINHGGMRDKGFFCPESLHLSMKSRFLEDKIMDKGEWKSVEEGTSTTLSKLEFGQFMEKIDLFIVDFFGIDTSAFWEEYKRDWSMT